MKQNHWEKARATLQNNQSKWWPTVLHQQARVRAENEVKTQACPENTGRKWPRKEKDFILALKAGHDIKPRMDVNT